jgi:hypothetical protein
MLQHLWVVRGSRDKADVFDGILYHFSHSLVEDNVSYLYTNVFCQIKMFLRARELKLHNKARKK